MKNTKHLLSILLLLLFQPIFSQQFKDFGFYCKNADKITLSTISYTDKTTVVPKMAIDSVTKLPYPLEENTKKSIIVTGKANLTIKEQHSLYKHLKTIEKGHSLPYEYDIQLDFYKKNKIIQTIIISSNTKNLVIKKKGCKEYIDENGQTIDPCFFQGMISNDLKKYIVALLKKKKLWNKEQQFFEDL